MQDKLIFIIAALIWILEVEAIIVWTQQKNNLYCLAMMFYKLKKI